MSLTISLPKSLLSELTTKLIFMNSYHHVDKTKAQLQLLTKDNPRVLTNFDHFIASLEKNCSESDTLMILEALHFAAQRHQFQYRSDFAKTPYIVHPIEVATHILEIAKINDTSILMAALLHDVVEDTDTSLEEIINKFGSQVAGYVDEVTDNKELSKSERKQLQIATAPYKSQGAAIIKMADKLANLSDLIVNAPHWKKERIEEYFRWSYQVISQLPQASEHLMACVLSVIHSYWNSASNYDTRIH